MFLSHSLPTPVSPVVEVGLVVVMAAGVLVDVDVVVKILKASPQPRTQADAQSQETLEQAALRMRCSS